MLARLKERIAGAMGTYVNCHLGLPGQAWLVVPLVAKLASSGGVEAAACASTEGGRKSMPAGEMEV